MNIPIVWVFNVMASSPKYFAMPNNFHKRCARIQKMTVILIHQHYCKMITINLFSY